MTDARKRKMFYIVKSQLLRKVEKWSWIHIRNCINAKI